MRSRDSKHYKPVTGHGFIKEKNSLGDVFVGQIIQWRDVYSTGAPDPSGDPEIMYRPDITSDSLEGVSYEIQRDYLSKSIMSFDGLIRPISIDGEGSLPRYIRHTTSNRERVKIDDLNPFANPSGVPGVTARIDFLRRRSDTPMIGHDIEVIARSGEDFDVPEDGLIMPPVANETGVDQRPDYRNDYRPFALRGPVLLQSWGYDVDGMPVPNKEDTELDASRGIFEKDPHSLDRTKFLDNHMRKSKTWAVAPIDLRLDKHRGIWTSGDRIVKARAEEEITPNSSGNVSIYKDGQELVAISGDPDVAYFNWMTSRNVPIESGTDLYVYYFADEQKWVIVGTDCGPILASSPATSPTGIPWSPEQILDDLAFWASSILGTTTPPFVHEWYDMSPNMINGISDDPQTSPTIILGAPESQSLNFNIGKYLVVESGVLLDCDTSDDLTLAIMFIPQSPPVPYGIFSYTPSPSGNTLLDTNNDQLSIHIDTIDTTGITYIGVGGVLSPVTVPVILEQPNLLIINKVGTSYDIRMNGVDISTETAGSALSEKLYIGKSVAYTGVFDSYFGSVQEMVLVAESLSTTDVDKLEGYIAHRFKVNEFVLPALHPYYTDPPYA